MKNIPLILAIDTSTGPCTVALTRGADMLAYARMDEYQSQSRRLMAMIDEVCTQAEIEPKNIDAVACTLGPGSFTSLRVGLSAARGLALALGKKCIGLSTLEVIAHGARPHAQGRTILALIDAHRGEVYAQRFSPQGKALEEPGALSLKMLAEKAGAEKLLVAGNARALAEPLLGPAAAYDDEATHPDARWLAALASEVYTGGRITSADPIYIRPPDAKLPA